MKTKIKIAPVKAINEENGTIDFVLTSKVVDRDGEVILPEGVRLDNFRKNPVFLWAHSRKDPPIGRVIPETIKVTENDISATVEFDMDDPFAKMIFSKYQKKHLNAGSISFIPKNFDKPIFEDQQGPTFTESELLEFSGVPIPSNPAALQKEFAGQEGNWMEMVKTFYEYHPKGGPEQWCKFMEGKKGLEFEVWKANGVDIYKIQSEFPKINYIEGYCKSLDVANEYLEASMLEYEWASRFCDCQVKELYMTYTRIDHLWKGSFYFAFELKTQEWKLHDIRRLTSSGKEEPPHHEVIRLNSKENITVLSNGMAFWDTDFGKFITKFVQIYSESKLVIYAHQKNRVKANEFINELWDYAYENHKMKGEAFSISGDFLKRSGVSWDDIFIKQKNRESLLRMVKSINERKAFLPNRGFILMGPPGTGKTLSGRVIMNNAETTFIWISVKDFVRKGAIGGLSQAFNLAKVLAPTILFIEDVDSWFNDYTVDFLKTEMDGIDQSTGIVTMLTTNYPERIPDALIDRPGRFHDILEFNLPEIEERKQMFSRWLPEPINKIFIDEFSKQVDGLSGAHIFELCQFAKILSEEKSISIEDALIEAFVKLDEQRRLLNDNQLSGSRYYPGKKINELAIEKDFEESPGKGAVSYSAIPTADRGRAWDGSGARNRIAKWASSDGSGDKDKISWPKYRRAFGWYDSGNMENFGSYKLPHHDVIDGQLKTVWRGVTTAMAALLGARGGTNIPGGDRRAVYNHLRRHYRQFDEDPPEFRDFIEVAEEMIALLQNEEISIIEKEEQYFQLADYYERLGLKAPELSSNGELTVEELLEEYQTLIVNEAVKLLQGGN